MSGHGSRAAMPRIGIIGSNWGRMHIGGFRGAGADIAALCGRDPAKTERIAAEEGIAMATSSVEALCAAVDAVVVAGPDRLHAAHIAAAQGAGCHVLSEKPLTHAAEDARALCRRAEAQTPSGARVCAVSFPYRMLPPFVALADWLGERAPAAWLTVTLRTSFGAAEGRAEEGPIQGASADFGGASHVLDAAFWLLRARPRWVEAHLVGRPAHSLAMHIGLDSGAVVAVNHAASHEPGIHGRWHLLGDGWEARAQAGYRPALGGWVAEPSEGFEGGAWRVLGERVAPHAGGEPWADAHRATAAAFLAAIAGARDPASQRLARFRHGADVQAAFAAAIASERAHARVDVELP
ncbi:Gfo/Idh/MocA family oxidoreductase [Haliangium ochraceum]|uniref:Oxidoreductase domain protein n=1 Tax=Haliangium ochraceum (strain DSM 14365 / JCM 11303 / SMP-2) TaxID=502025 RepID=D0LLA1_HALO1|nr:Gfo/Idh/MocA family oxidoreductase [Haliangium ochraceum]ACY18597.1 oxidoreductase domain protein [Haliangium ochraceum DSM 14365]